MKIRKGNINDLDQLVEFQQAMAMETENYEIPADKLKRGIQALLEDGRRGIYYVIEEENQLLACTMTTYEWSDWRNAWVLWIQSVYVRPEHRRKGLYSALYQHVKDIVDQDEHISGIRLYVDQTNKKAIQTYQDLGMTDEHYTMFEFMPND